MNMPLVFPHLRTTDVVFTTAMRAAQTRILGAHQNRGQMVVLTGKSGAGKTTAALHLNGGVNAACAGGAEHAFNARYYVATDMRRAAGDVLQRRLLAEFAKQVLRLTVPKDVRTIDVPGLMNTIAAGLRLGNIQMVFLDEAGHIPAAGLDHLATLINIVSTAEQHPLTVVLVGMHDLPTNVLSLPQVARRVTEFVYFEAYDVKTALLVLRTVHPFFETVDETTKEGNEVMAFLLDDMVSDGGLIGLMVPLVERAAAVASQLKMPFGIRALRLAHSMKNADAVRGREEMDRAWATTRVRA